MNHSTIFSLGSDNILTTKTFKRDKNDRLIYRSTKYEEEYIFNYDDQSRLQTVRSIKPNIPSDVIVAELIFDDHPKFPKLFKLIMGLDIQMECDFSGDTILFNFKTSIPPELIEMGRKQLGEDASEEELLQPLGPLGRIPKMYSKIYPAGQELFVEETFEENQEGIMEKTSTILFNSDWQILPKERKMYGFQHKIKYNLDDRGRTASVEIEDNIYPFEYDDNENVLKEYLDGNFIIYEYKNDKLMGN